MAKKRTPRPPAEGDLTLATGDVYTFDAPALLGGVTITVRKGETLPADVAAHLPEADRELFAPVAQPAA